MPPCATMQGKADVCNCRVDVVCCENGVEGRGGADVERQEEAAGVGLQCVSGGTGTEEAVKAGAFTKQMRLKA